MQPDTQDIIRWIHTHCLHGSAEARVSADSLLLDEAVLDSMQIMLLVAYLEEQTGRSIPLEDVVPENFETPRAIAAMVARLGA